MYGWMEKETNKQIQRQTDTWISTKSEEEEEGDETPIHHLTGTPIQINKKDPTYQTSSPPLLGHKSGETRGDL